MYRDLGPDIPSRHCCRHDFFFELALDPQKREPTSSERRPHVPSRSAAVTSRIRQVSVYGSLLP